MENDPNNNLQVTSSLSIEGLNDIAQKCQNSFSDSSSQLDEDKCYLMEIQQLKRQNNFLRKKIEDLNKKKRFSVPVSNAKRPSFNMGAVTEFKLEEPKNFIISFIDEIVKLLQNFSSLFDIQLESTLTKQLEQQNKALNQLATENIDHLNRRLNKILLSPEEEKFGQLLGIFDSYYRENSQKNKKIRQKVELLTTEAIELGKQMAVGVKQRESVKKSMKGSRFFSTIRVSQQIKDVKEECMNSSIIKSTCDGEQIDLGICKIALGKEKFFENLF